MRILVTGASGFIGRAFCRVAVSRGHRVQALARAASRVLPGVEVTNGSLESTRWDEVEQFAPEAALHLAWIATPGEYLTSAENEVWLRQSIAWCERLLALGPVRLAAAGTCIEYAASPDPLHEEDSPLAPAFPYSKAKAELWRWLKRAAGAASATWFRVFYPFGPGEHPSRVCSSLIRQLRGREPVTLRTPGSVKDYIFIDDAAMAICRSLEERLSGPVNVGTGRGISILDLGTEIARLLGVDPALVRPAAIPAEDPTPFVVADVGRLRGIGWSPQTSMTDGLRKLIESLPAPSPR